MFLFSKNFNYLLIDPSHETCSNVSGPLTSGVFSGDSNIGNEGENQPWNIFYILVMSLFLYTLFNKFLPIIAPWLTIIKFTRIKKTKCGTLHIQKRTIFLGTCYRRPVLVSNIFEFKILTLFHVKWKLLVLSTKIYSNLTQ